MKKYHEVNLDLNSELERLSKELRLERKKVEEMENVKETSFRAILSEREKAFQVEIEKSKLNMNKVIEESIRDKKSMEMLQ